MEQTSLEEMASILTQSESSPASKTEQLVLLSSFLAVDSSARATAIVQRITMPVLFACLHSDDSGQVRACCSVLKKLINAVDKDTFLADDLIVSGIKHKSSEVRLLCMAAARKTLSSDVACLALLESDTGPSLMQLLADEDLLCSQAAADFVSSAVQHDVCARYMFNADSPLLGELRRLLDASSTIRYRVLALVAKLCVASQDLLVLCSQAKMLSPLFDDLSTDDMLVRLNAIEVLGSLTASSHTVEHLILLGVVGQIADIIKTAGSNPLNQFILPGVFKFYGLMCDGGHASLPDLHKAHPEFLDNTLLLLAEKDSMLFLTLLCTIALVCCAKSGIRLVLGHELCTRAFSTVCRAITTGPSDAREQALVTMRVIFSAAEHAETDLNATEMAHAESMWYAPIASSSSVSPAQTVWAYAKDPSIKVRCAAFSLLAVFSRLPFGVRDLLLLPGFVEHLLDRATETEMSGWEAKYALVKAMAASSMVKESLDSVEYMQLRTYVRQGVVFVKGQVTAAVDDDYI